MKALVVDDSAVMRKVILGALNRAGIEDVEQAADGAEALIMVNQKSFGIVLMDWNMPNMLGIDALRQIRAQGHTVPVIMVTTEAEKCRVVDALKSGANNYVIKPFTPDVIIGKIKDTLERAGAA